MYSLFFLFYDITNILLFFIYLYIYDMEFKKRFSAS